MTLQHESRLENDVRKEAQCKVVDRDDNEYTSVILTYRIDSLQLKIQCDSYITSATSTPRLPRDSSLTSSGSLSLHLMEMQPKTDYVFNVTTYNGNVTIPFSITGIQCKYGVMTILDSLGTVNLTVSYNDTVYYTGGRFLYFCIPTYTYQYHMECIKGPSHPICSFTARHDNGELLIDRSIMEGETIDGEFESIASRAPQVMMQHFIALPANDQHFLDPKFDGIVGNVTLVTKGHHSLVYSGTRLTLRNPLRGIEVYTMTVSNAFGSTDFDLTVCIETCPEGMDFFCVDSHVQPPEYYEITSVKGQYIHTFFYEQTNCFCSPENELTIHMASADGRGYETTNPVVVSDLDGMVSDFHIPRGQVENTRTIRYHALLSEGSSFRFFKGAEVSGWNAPSFNDAAWGEGTKGHWGSFSPEHAAFFRTRVALGKTEGYEMAILTAKLYGLCHVYLDGVLVARINATESLTHRKYLPLPLFRKQSVVAVALESQSNKTIEFDLSLHLAASMCSLQSVYGKATSNDTEPSHIYKPDDAFSLYRGTTWQTDAFPVTLDYAFANGDVAVVNKFTMRNAKDVVPRKFAFQGVIGDEVVTLFSYEGDRFMTYGKEQIFEFENSRFFSTYRFVFQEKRGEDTLKLGGIRLLYCAPITCPKKWGTPLSPPGTAFYKNCPIGSTGMYARRCDDVDGYRKWVDDRSTCLASMPSQGVAFVDWSFRLTHMYFDEWPDVKEAMIVMLLKHITVFREQITFVMVRDLTEDEIAATQVTVRFVVNSRIGDYIQYSMGLTRDEFGAWVKSEVSDKYDACIVGDVVLHNPVSITMVCTCCLIALIVLVLAFGWYRAQLSVKKMKGKKSLKRVENSEMGMGSSLLTEA